MYNIYTIPSRKVRLTATVGTNANYICAFYRNIGVPWHSLIYVPPLPQFGEGVYFLEKTMDEKRLALVGIIIENETAVEKVNSLLHEFGNYIVGRMGLPYRDRGVSVISVVIDAPSPVINSLTGKLGMQSGVSAKALYSSK